MLSFHDLCTSLSFQKWSPSPESGPPPFSACQRVERSPLKAQLATRGESPLPSPCRDDRILTASITGIFFFAYAPACIQASSPHSFLSLAHQHLSLYRGKGVESGMQAQYNRGKHVSASTYTVNSISRKRCICTRLPMLGNQAGCPP